MAAFSTAANQALLDKYFGKGVVKAGSGGGNAALANAPKALVDAYTAERRQFADQSGFNYTPQTTAPQGNYNGGVVPVGQVEPLNQWQKDALTMQQGGAPDSGYSQGIQNAFQGYQSAVQQLPQNMTDAQFAQYYARYNNPFTQDVVDATNADIRRQADIMRNPLKERFAGNNSFGSSAQGIQMGQIDEAALRDITNNTANLRSQGFNQATGNTLANYGQDTSNAFNRAGQYGNLMQAGIQGQQQNQQNFAQNFGNKFNAGTAVQTQNQNLLDVVRGQIGGVQQYPYTQLQNFAQTLSPFSGGSSTGYNYAPSTLGKLGGAAMVGAGGFYNPATQQMGPFSVGNLFGGTK
jgi:hypothetical protein